MIKAQDLPIVFEQVLHAGAVIILVSNYYYRRAGEKRLQDRPWRWCRSLGLCPGSALRRGRVGEARQGTPGF